MFNLNMFLFYFIVERMIRPYLDAASALSMFIPVLLSPFFHATGAVPSSLDAFSGTAVAEFSAVTFDGMTSVCATDIPDRTFSVRSKLECASTCQQVVDNCRAFNWKALLENARFSHSFLRTIRSRTTAKLSRYADNCIVLSLLRSI